MSAAHARQLPIQSAHGLPSSPSPTPVLPPECTYLTLILLLRGHSTPIPHPTLITHSSTPRPMILPEKSLSLSAIPNGAPDSLMAASPTSLRGAHHATPPHLFFLSPSVTSIGAITSISRVSLSFTMAFHSPPLSSDVAVSRPTCPQSVKEHRLDNRPYGICFDAPLWGHPIEALSAQGPRQGAIRRRHQ